VGLSCTLVEILVLFTEYDANSTSSPRKALPCKQRFWFTMRLFHAVTVVQLLAAQLVAAALFDSPSVQPIYIDPTVESLEALAQLQRHAFDTISQRDHVSKRELDGCTWETASIRRDW